jgi:hypothetical protein
LAERLLYTLAKFEWNFLIDWIERL